MSRYGKMSETNREHTIQGLKSINTYFSSMAIEASRKQNNAEREAFISRQMIIDDAITFLREKEGEWLDVDEKQDAFDCSLCGAMVGRKCLYCPGCGAKMINGTRTVKTISADEIKDIIKRHERNILQK